MTDIPQLDITDVADWFLNKEQMIHKKLQKLCYYSVAWSYALFDDPLCRRDEFQAWIHGPVNPMLYNKYRHMGWNLIRQEGVPPSVSEETDEFLEMIWNTYGEFSGHQLEALTHEEDPWIIARGELPLSEPSTNVISPSDMASYYNSIYDKGQND
ncbi:MAG: DUF4065 domain-containing protein [Methanosarcinales archaeon]|jgi:uncharacterized phage-associated protein|nr:DUF4065 domain-containing protein [Methanosarcinales archaeon]